jgi:DNA-binding LytR/AlgR family response regulator
MAQVYNCLIIDDEEPARDLISNYIEKIDFLNEIGSYKGVISAREALELSNVDMIFLDIQMSELNGLDFLKQTDKQIPVVLTTAYKKYAIDAFDLDVVDYLLKPINFQRFYQAVNKVIKRLSLESESVVSDDFISIQSNYKLIKVKLDDILYIESDSEYVYFHTQDGKKYMVLESLKNLQSKLPNNFYRIHKSYIVSISKVTEQEGNFVRIQGNEIPIGRSNKKEALQIIFGK